MLQCFFQCLDFGTRFFKQMHQICLFFLVAVIQRLYFCPGMLLKCRKLVLQCIQLIKGFSMRVLKCCSFGPCILGFCCNEFHIVFHLGNFSAHFFCFLHHLYLLLLQLGFLGFYFCQQCGSSCTHFLSNARLLLLVEGFPLGFDGGFCFFDLCFRLQDFFQSGLRFSRRKSSILPCFFQFGVELAFLLFTPLFHGCVGFSLDQELCLQGLHPCAEFSFNGHCFPCQRIFLRKGVPEARPELFHEVLVLQLLGGEIAFGRSWFARECGFAVGQEGGGLEECQRGPQPGPGLST
mmetsp:Transcript_1957/g.12334  ORF Transcript_1957/g.12334 Transcript_1957/m.12334 type:complete len:292 (-) Transcript_1957:469-1344(-)